MATKLSEKKKVLVGMSGGIDSSAVCMLLQDQGYEVLGITLRMWDIPSHFSTLGQKEPDHVLEARSLAERLAIPHYTLDVRDEFRKTVVQSFINEYLRARTPNPCVMCNLYFKWKYLLDEADRLECDYIATGHYARITQNMNRYILEKGLDPKKDQSYFLWRLGQKELSRTLFPLGNITKEEIKTYVLQKGFKEKVEKKESMEVCFIENDYRDFLLQQIPNLNEVVGKGFFVDKKGKKLGLHKGFPFYTIGQRKGLEIALGHPAYVIKINPYKNTIRLGDKEDLLTTEMLVESPVINIPIDQISDREIQIRIRYRSPAIRGTLFLTDDNYIVVKFKEPVSAVTPGQSAVFYSGNQVIGGGIISDQHNLKKHTQNKTQV